MCNTMFGLITLVLGIAGVIAWWGEFGAFLRGCVPAVLLIFGLIAVGAGLKTEIKRTIGEKAKGRATKE